FVALSIAALTGWTRHVSATPASVATPVNAGNSPCVDHPAPAGQGAAVPPVYATLPYGSNARPEYVPRQDVVAQSMTPPPMKTVHLVPRFAGRCPDCAASVLSYPRGSRIP